MKQFLVNRQNIKQAAKNVGLFLKEKNVSLSHSDLLHLIAKLFFYKNWQTLEASFDEPLERKPFKEVILVLETPLPDEQLFSIFEKVSRQANCKCVLKKVHEQGNRKEFKVEVQLQNQIESNFIVFVFLLCEYFKKNKLPITQGHYWETRIECQDFMQIFEAKS